MRNRRQTRRLKRRGQQADQTNTDFFGKYGNFTRQDGDGKAGHPLRKSQRTIIKLCAPDLSSLNRRMIDMLVRLYDLPESALLYDDVAKKGVTLRRARAFEKHTVAAFVKEHFSAKWVSELEVALSRQPITCFIATREKQILGFACYDTTLRGFFGPTGVSEDARGLGVGKALLFKSLEGLRDLGHAYAIIGGVGPREFYEKACGAIEIPGSDPGTYTDLLP
jgi:predicted N-acetyltransferase YhbS